MDNRLINIKSDNINDFKLAMCLASNGRKAVGYRIFENKLILYWVKSNKMIPLPYEMDTTESINFTWGWVSKAHPKYKEPDHDGDNKVGFHVVSDNWSKIEGEWEAYVSIEPIWAVYGK